MFDTYDVITILHENIYVKGVPIKESEMCITLSDMNVPDQSISDYSNSIHNRLRTHGKEDVERKIITIFRINPLVAVKMIESCRLVEDIDRLAYSIKPLFSVLREGGYYGDREANEKMIINNNKVPYVVLLIEAVFQNSIGSSTVWNPNMFLEYAQSEDMKLHKKGIRPKYLNAYNIRHIFRNIPENRQIEFINWFWERHCYAAKKFGKVETFASGRVSVMMSEISEGSIWQHLENEERQVLSQIEQERLTKEKEGIKRFIEAVVSEGKHLQFIKIILGEYDFNEKMNSLVGDDIIEAYEKAIESQTLDQ